MECDKKESTQDRADRAADRSVIEDEVAAADTADSEKKKSER
jgi:hypothetical protein